jgi:4-hydroxy-tetrahydrodipicolinate reductase
MRILLIGYGKMGQAIEGIAIKKGHTIIGKIDAHNVSDLQQFNQTNTDAAIEFTHPAAAFENIKYCLNNGIPLVCGTTGWLDKKTEIEEMVEKLDGCFCYSSNFSIGVNLFWALNEKLAQLMNAQTTYDVTMEEIHHVYKKDAPSGTAITTAEGAIKYLDRKTNWTIDISNLTPKEIFIEHKREHNIPGTHTVLYTSPVDSIALKHTAFNREGFASGAVLAAEYIKGKTGIYGMKDVLSL